MFMSFYYSLKTSNFTIPNFVRYVNFRYFTQKTMTKWKFKTII